MKPVFCNTFNLSHNKNQSEITLTFSHVYTEHNFSMQKGSLTDVSAQVVDEVSSILVSREGAIALTRLLNRVVGEWGVNIDE